MSKKLSAARKDLYRLREFDRKLIKIKRRKARAAKLFESGQTRKIGGAANA